MVGRCSLAHYIRNQEVSWESQIGCIDYQADMLDISEHPRIPLVGQFVPMLGAIIWDLFVAIRCGSICRYYKNGEW